MVIEGDEDLTERVFPSRHATFERLLARLRQRGIRGRLTRLYAQRRWQVEPAELERFLAASTALNPCRFYEYHLVQAHKPCREEH
jgi:hypothetical protein